MHKPTLKLPAAVSFFALAASLADAVQLGKPTKQAAKPEKCHHETCRVSALYGRYINETWGKVAAWPVNPADPNTTDQLAVTIFQPPTEESARLFEYSIRANMHRLGPKWGLQIFYGSDSDRRLLSKQLGYPRHAIWTRITIRGERRESINKSEANWLRLTREFWDAIDPKHENVLMFESDSLVLRGHGCVERFLGYDYVGAPWKNQRLQGLYHGLGGNGGLSLRTRSTNLLAVQHRWNEKNVASYPGNFTWHEDGEMTRLLVQCTTWLHNKKGAYVAHRNVSMHFAVESIYAPDPCGFHNPWEFLTEEEAEQLLATAEFD